jgi:hypothetical protein
VRRRRRLDCLAPSGLCHEIALYRGFGDYAMILPELPSDMPVFRGLNGSDSALGGLIS